MEGCTRSRKTVAATLAVSALLLTACAVNPATGKRQFVLVSEQQEIQLGRENDKAIVEQMGLYDDPELQEYVQQLGARLASGSERPNLDWTFRVVDDPMINAFALPGGYLYVTRGILAHMDNEAELVSVLGHEIGHVTARHGVSQMSRAQLAQLGLGLGGILAPEKMQDFGSLAQTGLGLLFLKHGRDDERQADDLGLRYLVKLGYDPSRMPDVFEMLGRVSAAQGEGRVPGWLSTHPVPENRRQRISEQVASLDTSFSPGQVRREAFLAMIDNITFGENPRDGFFRDNLFLHPEMEFRLEFPAGWKVQNQRSAVVGVTEQQDAMVQLTLAAESTAAEALQKFFSQEGVNRTGPAMGSISGMTTAGDSFSVAQEGGALRGRVGFVEYGGRVFRLLGLAVETQWNAYESPIRAALASFDRLRDRRALEAQPKRLKVVQPTQAMSLAEFAERYDATVPVETLALINGLEADGRVAPGQPYKVVTGGVQP